MRLLLGGIFLGMLLLGAMSRSMVLMGTAALLLFLLFVLPALWRWLSERTTDEDGNTGIFGSDQDFSSSGGDDGGGRDCSSD
ncbi:hypothetical protein IGB42_00730 [Andreprevotia sp. IGB-42]|uniref:hypothetical protein n=1 Tax=Andreprevotia sp. IGB-42 TaxID=2497473 RepID=UPI00135CF5BE|nr:hypothetical protein [Andreprevotia sp. IGB-42]KAF0814675.1 hypothetical protein IGB42_00730 [Andreprevotia sp. IGB-42]